MPPARRHCRDASPPCRLKVTARGPCSKDKLLMGSSVPALPPPPPPPPSAGELCPLQVRERSIVWLGEIWEEAGTVLLGQPLAGGCRAGQSGPALRLLHRAGSCSPAALLSPTCSVPTWREAGALLAEQQPGSLTLPAPQAQGERDGGCTGSPPRQAESQLAAPLSPPSCPQGR